MNYFICIFVFFFGLIIGSFINCVIYRLHAKKSFLRGRSFCPKCKHQLVWYDNIPVLSFLLLKGKCRYCQKKISIQYPLVELITGILFIIVFIITIKQFNNLTILDILLNCSIAQLLMLFRNWVFTAILIIIFIYDLKYCLILDKITIPAMVIALVLNITVRYMQIGLADKLFYYFIILLFSGVICGGFFLIQFLVSKGKWIGGGDIRLGFLMGLMLGWPYAIAALFISYIIGSVIGLGLILSKRKTIKSQVPFGTFLGVGTFIALLWGDWIVQKYLNLL
ncbi:MAG: prepilin peptidase [Candidatus Kuenenbacteria bacterium]